MQTYESFEPKELVVFDMITMVALKYFELQKVDFAVLEVGIGGTLDSTNIVNSDLSIISKLLKISCIYILYSFYWSGSHRSLRRHS